MNYRINKRIIADLEEALRAATMKTCGVADEHKEAMRIYMQTWVEGPLERALRAIKNEKAEMDV